MPRADSYTVDFNAPQYSDHGDGLSQNLANSIFYDFTQSGVEGFDTTNPDIGNSENSVGQQEALDARRERNLSFMKDKGYVLKAASDKSGDYQWLEDANGNMVGKEQRATNDDDWYAIASTMLLGAFTGGAGLGSTLGSSMGLSGTVANTVGTGLINAANTAGNGGDVKQSLLSTGASLGLNGLGSLIGVNNLNPQLSAAITGGVTAAAKGGNPLEGAIQGGINSFISTGNPFLDRIMKTAVSKQIPKFLG